MGLLSVISGLLKPVSELVDAVHTSKEEILEKKAKFLSIQGEILAKAAEYEGKLLESQSNIIMAETKGDGWLQKSWRPVVMLVFTAMVVSDGYGWLTNPLSPKAWGLLQLGLGGYVIGRSAEKIVPKVLSVLKK